MSTVPSKTTGRLVRRVKNNLPSPADLTVDGVPLPEWVKEFRPAQWDAITECVEHFKEGADVVILEAPTGSGKTLIAETVRRRLKQEGLVRNSVYVCSSISLQDQFLRDFPYAKLLKGKTNYPTQNFPYPDITCADCTLSTSDSDRPECAWCSNPNACSYQVAKREATRSPLMVINTAYFLTEANYVGRITTDKDLVIVDECDVLESELMNFIEFTISDRMLSDLGLTVPKKGSHKETILTWLRDQLLTKLIGALQKPFIKDDIRAVRRRNSLERAKQATEIVLSQTEGEEPWVRDNDAGPLVLKPVKVDWAGQTYLWKHGQRWLIMSATVVSSDEMVHSLGMEGLNVQVVRHPMTFPVENRKIIVAGVENVIAKNEEAAVNALSHAIEVICEQHPEDRILVHTVSYKLARQLFERCSRRNKFTYSASNEKEKAINDYGMAEGSILFAPSLDRGADFKDDLCRVVVVAKMPFLYLGDRQVSARLHTDHGSEWYAVQTIRSLVQMTGRGVRSAEDYAITYILDRQFMDNVYKRSKYLLPDWWAEALDFSYPVKKLLPKH